MMRRMSACEYGLNDASDADAVVGIDGGGNPSVAVMTSSTLRSKKVANPSAEWPVELVTLRSRPSAVDSERHKSVDDFSC